MPARRQATVAAPACLVALCGACATAPLTVPLVGDRPDFTESAATIAPRHVQLEAGYTFARAGHTTSHSVGELLVRAGLSERAELRVGLNSVVVAGRTGDRETGIEDASLGTKLMLLTGARGARPDLAVIFATSLPTGSSAFGSDDLQPEAVLAAAWPLSERVALSANGVWAYPSESGERFSQGAASVSLGIAAGARSGFYLEYHSFHPIERDGDSAHYADAGVTRLLTQDLQLDVRIGRRLANGRPDGYAGVGVVRRW